MIRLSPTRLQRWYECGCPAAWNFEREWEPKIPNVMAARGIIVHKILDGSIKKSKVEDKLALRMAASIEDAVVASGIKLIGEPEVKEEFLIREDVTWVRKIDRMATMNGRTIVVDWKSSGAGWRSGENAEGQFTPQANAMQSIGYLLPNPDGWIADGPPKTILYFVVGMRGPAQVYRYDWKDDDLYNFNELVDSAARQIDSHYFPKVYGKHCLGNSTTPPCPMHQVCFQTPGWRKIYNPIPKKKEKNVRTKRSKT